MERKTSTRKASTPRTRRAPAKKPAAKTKTPRQRKSTGVTPPVAVPVSTRLRRAIFVDVENTSREADLLSVLEHLKIERTVQPTEIIAIGNWKSVGARVARILAGLGAQLLHSAPAGGVRDWSDLWIAVAAGRWIATAVPGDVLEIVSDDRAFDAVGDAAAAAGVVFRRLSYRALSGSTQPAVTVEPADVKGRRRRRRRGRTHAPASAAPLATKPSAPPASQPAAATRTAEEEAHTASLDHIRATLTRLAGGSNRWISLDATANALRTEGFVRPPGSPRLVTRLRNMKDVEVSPAGMVRLRTPTPGEESLATTAEAPSAGKTPRRRRPRKRGTTKASAPASPAEDSAA